MTEAEDSKVETKKVGFMLCSQLDSNPRLRMDGYKLKIDEEITSSSCRITSKFRKNCSYYPSNSDSQILDMFQHFVQFNIYFDSYNTNKTRVRIMVSF
jgi:hypothetical protein